MQLAQETTASPIACMFLPLADPTQLELAARTGVDAAGEPLSLRARWRGMPPQDTAIYECLSSQRTVVRDAYLLWRQRHHGWMWS